MEDLKLDISDIDVLLSHSKRPIVIELLKNKKVLLEKQLALLTQQPVKVNKVVEEAKVADVDPLTYTPLTKYSFEQDGKKIKIYILLDKVGEVAKENIVASFDKQSFDLKIRGYSNQNLRLSIKKLHGLIDNTASTFVQKNNSVIITLISKDQSNWPQLQWKENAINPDKLGGKNEDPQASLMNMMKEMYNTGDDEMKRTIAKAWSEQQSGKTPSGLGGMGGMGGMGM